MKNGKKPQFMPFFITDRHNEGVNQVVEEILGKYDDGFAPIQALRSAVKEYDAKATNIELQINPGFITFDEYGINRLYPIIGTGEDRRVHEEVCFLNL